MKKKSYLIASMILTATLLGGLSQSKIISYACEKDEYLVVTENKDVNVKNISRLQADTLEYKDEVMCVERVTNVSGSGKVDNTMKKINNEYEWNLKMINAENVNSLGDKIKVAILDSGVDYLEDINVVKRRNFIDKYDDMEVLFDDSNGHGTGIASIVGAKYNNKTEVKGVNSNIEIYSGKILDEYNSAPMNRVIEGIYWAIEEDVDIISISFGTKNNSKALEMAIKEAYDKGILIVAAAGNTHSNLIEYPAAYDEVLAVGGVNSNGEISTYSSVSDKINVFAPGEQVKVLGAFDGEVVVSGTSIAVPHVVGVASVLWQKDRNKTNEFIKGLIEESSNKSTGLADAGIVDLEHALKVFNTFNVLSKNDNCDNNVPMENTSQLYIEPEVNYVTGSWCGKEHQESVTLATSGKLSVSDVNLMKWGAIYSDKSSNLKGMTTNPYFHGYNKKKDYKQTKQAYNYIAGYIYLTRCALVGEINQDKTDLLNTTGNILEMDEKLNLINFAGSEYIESENSPQRVLQGRINNAKNRSLLLWGMAMHTAADIYAHSSYANVNGEWIYISHDSTEIKEADNKDYEPKRYEAAKKVVNNVLNNYLLGREGSVDDFILSEEYYDGSFKIRNLYNYANEIAGLNGTQRIVLQKVTRFKE